LGAGKVLVTGHGGFLGGAIVAQLLESGYEVRGLARGEYPHWERQGVESIRGSLADAGTVESAVQGCDSIIHTAARAGVWGAWEDYYQPNTVGTQCLLDAARRAGVRAVVFTSSPSVTFAAAHQSGMDETAPYPQRWLCHYPHTKALAEQAVLAAAERGEVRACALRPHLIWGEGDPHLMPRVIQRAQAGRLMCVGTGSNRIDVVHVRHAARAHLLALEKLVAGDDAVNGQAFFITDGQPQACWGWISRILTTAGVAVPRKRIPYRIAYALGAALEVVYRLGRRRDEPAMTRFVAAQLALDHYFSIEKARARLGYAPVVDLEEEFAACEPWLKRVAAGG
jgi:2-alkyl-3-oxoalkanoate reductase